MKITSIGHHVDIKCYDIFLLWKGKYRPAKLTLSNSIFHIKGINVEGSIPHTLIIEINVS